MEQSLECQDHQKTKEDDTELHIQFQFLKGVTVYFAYTYPFSYQQCERFLQKTQKEANRIKPIYYCDEILIRSPQGRNIHLVTLSSNDHISDRPQNIESNFIFPEEKSRASQFSSQKKVVIVSARVHPAQAPSSHTFNGLIKFLLSKDARAHFLRKNFVFKLIPMLNPDGVSNGHYRMDIYNQNLNRFYLQPDPLLQPSAFAVKQLGHYYSSKKSLCFYIDLHAHPQRKGNFIYGNSFQNSQSQIETQLFAKILSLNCVQFDYQNSSFDQKHMTLKDKNEALTKQGCGRVVFQKQFSQVYSYTMECGYTASNQLNQIVSIDKGNRKFEKHAILPDELQNVKSPYYSGGKKNLYFTIQSYEALGKAVAVSILDVFSLNPASRIPNTPFRNLDGIRKQISFKLQRISNNSNLKKYYLKPNSQQAVKGNSQSVNSKTISSVGYIKFKPSIQKKPILTSFQFLFLQNKAQSQKQKKQKPQSSPSKKRPRNSTLPKVNIFKLNNMQKNIMDMNEQ